VADRKHGFESPWVTTVLGTKPAPQILRLQAVGRAIQSEAPRGGHKRGWMPYPAHHSRAADASARRYDSWQCSNSISACAGSHGSIFVRVL